jgi:hypothetical protein
MKLLQSKGVSNLIKTKTYVRNRNTPSKRKNTNNSINELDYDPLRQNGYSKFIQVDRQKAQVIGAKICDARFTLAATSFLKGQAEHKESPLGSIV